MNTTPPTPDDPSLCLAPTFDSLSITPGTNPATGIVRCLKDDTAASDPNADCWLPLELIESVLIAAAALIVASDSQLSKPATKIKRSNQNQKTRPLGKTIQALANLLVFATHDIQPVARAILPRLPHAWPPTRAAAQGRTDALKAAHGLGMIDRWLTDPTVSLDQMIEAANTRGHADVLRWIHAHWQQDAMWCRSGLLRSMIQSTILRNSCAFSGTRGADMLEFWIVESGVDFSQAVAADNVEQALNDAFAARNVAVLRWWGNHSTLLGDRGSKWDWNWVEQAIRSGDFALVDVCAEVYQTGRVSFIAKQRPAPQLFAGSMIEEVVAVSERIMDLASQVGQVDMLEKWIQRQETRGLPLVYSQSALDLCDSIPILDWWLQSGLPLKYSHVALHRATARREIKVLDWWLAAYRNGSIPELKYDSWIMTLASCDGTFDSSFTVRRITVCSGWPLVVKALRVLQWWNDSQLDLKLPSDLDLQQGAVIPSPIDLCTDTGVLDWWLNRAQRLCLKSPSATIQGHFPRFTQAAMHRAAYWNCADVLDWWFKKGKAAGLEPRYAEHRMIELAAMTPSMQQRSFGVHSSALSWCFKNLPTVQFRGNLLEWVQSSGSGSLLATGASSARNARASRGLRTGAQVAMENVRKIWSKYAPAVACENGGLPPPDCGYVRQEQGEKFVFF